MDKKRVITEKDLAKPNESVKRTRISKADKLEEKLEDMYVKVIVLEVQFRKLHEKVDLLFNKS